MPNHHNAVVHAAYTEMSDGQNKWWVVITLSSCNRILFTSTDINGKSYCTGGEGGTARIPKEQRVRKIEREREQENVGETRHRWNYRHWHFGFIISDAEKSPYRSSTDKMPTKWHTPKCDTRDATLYAAVHTQNNIRFAFFLSFRRFCWELRCELRVCFVCASCSRKINTSSKSINSQSGSKLCSNQYFIHLAEWKSSRYTSHCVRLCTKSWCVWLWLLLSVATPPLTLNFDNSLFVCPLQHIVRRAEHCYYMCMKCAATYWWVHQHQRSKQ